MTSCRLLTAAPWLCSVGDVAIAETTSNELARRGVSCVQSFRGPEVAVIGGGHLLSPQPGVCAGMLDRFRITGKHCLNAPGVRTEDRKKRSWWYLRNYLYLSVRDAVSANRIGLPDIHIVPCPATLTEPLTLSQMSLIPRLQWLAEVKPKSYVSLHPVETVNHCKGLPADAIAIEPQPWMARNPVHRWRSIPPTHSPGIVAGVIANSKALVTRSLHAGIFALSAGVPFVCLDQGDDPQSIKLRAYFERAGIPEAVAAPTHPVRYAMEIAPKVLQVSKLERQRTVKHFDKLAAAIKSHTG